MQVQAYLMGATSSAEIGYARFECLLQSALPICHRRKDAERFLNNSPTSLS